MPSQSTYLSLGADQQRYKGRYRITAAANNLIPFPCFASDRMTNGEDTACMLGGVCLFFFPQPRRCLHFVLLSEKCHWGMLIFVLFVFRLLSLVAHKRCRAGSCREDMRRLIFYPSPPVASVEGEALSPAICLPAPGIVIPRYRPVNISLVTAASPPQPSRARKAEGGRRGGYTASFFPSSFFLMACKNCGKKNPCHPGLALELALMSSNHLCFVSADSPCVRCKNPQKRLISRLIATTKYLPNIFDFLGQR